ncbi:23S rRNA (adenine(1618)-N(6))-methyltransferase RlmF [Paraglaciecola aquimarina]|uniref:Ribosomal RNA large subunit methyltransferase F n=1 Tax=Paraglaciecola algarum TaxID=3050085 RepID=A0ABS9D1G2_9ALTE|nr:23S rRNA (adenine(1618)-N(6))-methyltransferase RlmF [Paraglaciecola sp. G1-23]MCF2946701.1 23S rRNA (adenine(1618)-N(6))-methyltransferase RlmF [Paraglaciecola sp. G1-23]
MPKQTKVKTSTGFAKKTAVTKVTKQQKAKRQQLTKPIQGNRLHPRSLHSDGYPLDELVSHCPDLQTFVIIKPDGGKTINFSEPDAVKALNAALLDYYYQIKFWDIPTGYLCPPIPGRADYVHHIADLLAENQLKEVAKNSQVIGLDIGTGANLVYPILANRIYGWNMYGTDIDPVSIKSAENIILSNPVLKDNIQVVQQSKPTDIFTGVVASDQVFDFCMCNPPFHASAKEAQAGSMRKVNNLAKHAKKRQSHMAGSKIKSLNFSGQANELWCEGGELAFIQRMITQSPKFAKQIKWFTCLVSKKEHLPQLTKVLEQSADIDWKVVDMAQGQKISRFLAWRFNFTSK